jgi:hypothetical protein
MMQPSKPTWYRGVWFRSCLEARWAATFDQFRIHWRYEAAHLELVSGRYTPDFWLPKLKWWAEVKPNLESAEIGRYKEVVDLERRPFLVLVDKPIVGVYKIHYIRGRRNRDLMGQFALLQNSSQLWIADESRAAPMNYAGMPNVVPPGLTVNSTVIVDKMNVANQRIDFR